MQYPSRRLALRNGGECLLRSPGGADAAARAEFWKKAYGQTPYLARDAAQSASDTERIGEMLEEQLDLPDCVEICAWVDGALVACGSVGPVSRESRRMHRARLGVAVLREYGSLGVGSGILRALIGEAAKMGYHQVELNVSAENLRARSLYAHLGFQPMGRIPDALRYADGRYADEIQMFLRLTGDSLDNR